MTAELNRPVSEDGRELLTADQMRAVEQAAMASGAVTGLELMERAGQGVVAAIFAEWPELDEAPGRAVVLCGPGNNGGDGFVIARLLHDRGWAIDLFHYGERARLSSDAAANADAWVNLGTIRPWAELGEETTGDLWIDAIFGAGQTRAPSTEIMKPLVEAYVSGRTFERMVAVDCPTGLAMDSGRALSEEWGAVYAWLTVTFHRARPGHYLAEGPETCGRLVVADIGLNSEAIRAAGPVRPRPTLGTGANLVSLQGRPETRDLAKHSVSHKFDHGHALILSGPPGRGGAARLAARGALRVGAGLVTLACPLRAVAEHAARLDAIMVRPLDSAAGLAELLEDKRITAVGMGPGLGLGAETARLVQFAAESGKALVLDADALSRFERSADALFGMLHETCVLTPHAGEFARLFPDVAEKLNAPADEGPAYSKIDATREAAARAGCTVLFKGADTVIADQTGEARVHSAHYDRAAPWLATAGSGDVLAGIITGLLARRFEPMEAAATGALLHTEAALAFGPGLIAEDIPEMLPKVFADLGL